MNMTNWLHYTTLLLQSNHFIKIVIGAKVVHEYKISQQDLTNNPLSGVSQEPNAKKKSPLDS